MYTVTLIQNQQTIKATEQTDLDSARNSADMILTGLAREGAIAEIRYARVANGAARYNVLIESKTFKRGKVSTLKPIYPPLLEQLSDWAKPLKAARA